MSFRSAVGHGEASGAHNGVQMQLHWLMHSVGIEESCMSSNFKLTNSIGQIHLQLMLASILLTNYAGPFNY